MKESTVGRRLAAWKVALGATGVVAASLALAASAGAAVIHVTPDNYGVTDNLASAITTANTNTDPSNTILLAPGQYSPLNALPPITKALRIAGDDHSQQANGSPTYDVDGSCTGGCSNPNPNIDLFTINPGVTVEMDGFAITGASNYQNAVIRDNGTLNAWNLAIEANGGVGLALGSTSVATLNASLVDSMTQTAGITDASGQLTLNNTTVSGNARGGVNNAGGTLTLRNTLLAYNDTSGLGGKDCQSHAQVVDHSMDDDGTCGITPASNSNVQYWNNSANGFPGANFNGGPTGSVQSDPVNYPGAPTDNAGDPATCLHIDQRFFVEPTGTTCDIGAVSNDAQQETTGPACVVTALIAGPPKQQQVTLSDPSGIGPQQGPLTDPTSNAAADDTTNLAITNGTVSSNAPASTAGPTWAGVVLTATKTDQTQSTVWNFTGTNWAGVSKFCN